MSPLTHSTTRFSPALWGVQNHRLIFPRLKWTRRNVIVALNTPGTSTITARVALALVAALGKVFAAPPM
jgi:hypothetical protein